MSDTHKSSLVSLDQRTFEWIVKSLAMVSVDNNHQALVAARTADRLVRDAGLQWSDIITRPALAKPQPPPPKPPRPEPGAGSPGQPPDINSWPGGWRQAGADVLKHGKFLLSDWEVEFVEGLNRFPRLSAKQAAVLNRLLLRVVAAGRVP